MFAHLYIYIGYLCMYRSSLQTLLYMAISFSSLVNTGVHAEDVHEYQLANGLKLIVKEDHRAPVVVTQIWYKVGSSYEHDGLTGVSHALEHMMFKGTEKVPRGAFSEIIAENGGRENAFTGKDYTAYFQRLEKSRLSVSFRLEADRMRNLILKEDDFAKEIQVVIEERRLRTEDSPQALVYEQLMASAFMTSPYRFPIIGWMDDLANLTVADLRSWYKRWYAPNNATLVVVGDVKSAMVLALAKQYFGGLQVEEIAPPKPRREVLQKGMRRIVVAAPAKLPYILMGYKVPVLSKQAADAWEPYALEVLAGILDGGDSARLARRLVRGNQMAASAGASYSLSNRLPSLLLLDATPSQGHTVEAIEKALRDEIAALSKELTEPEELARVKAQVVAGHVFEKDSGFYMAMQIGILETVGLGWRVADQYVARIQAVTREQIQEVAKKYLIDANLTVAVLDPQPVATTASKQGGNHHGH